MSASKRDQASQHIRHLRVELRELSLMLGEDGILPSSGEIKALYAQLEELLDLVKGIKKKPNPNSPKFKSKFTSQGSQVASI